MKLKKVFAIFVMTVIILFTNSIVFADAAAPVGEYHTNNSIALHEDSSVPIIKYIIIAFIIAIIVALIIIFLNKRKGKNKNEN